MHGTVAPATAKPVEQKYRTITLTNRAPVQIVEDDWPVIAQGGDGEDDRNAPVEWQVQIRVRRYNKKDPSHFYGRTIIHASYDYCEEWDPLRSHQQIRVGRILTANEAATDLWKHILEVGEELKSRIHKERMRKYVMGAVDRCFAKLPPHSLP